MPRPNVILDTVKGYRLQSRAQLSFLINIYSFNDQKEFDEFFHAMDGNSTPFDFDKYWLAAVVTDNKTPVMGHGGNDMVRVQTFIQLDSSYTQRCKLTVPFVVGALRDRVS